MFLHVAMVAEEEHVIYLLLVLTLQLFILSGEPYPELFHLLLQSLVLLIGLLVPGLRHISFLRQPAGLDFDRFSPIFLIP